MSIFDITKADVERMKDNKNIKGLVKALKNKRNPIVRCEAAIALGKLGDVGSRERFYQSTKLLEDDSYVQKKVEEEISGGLIGKIRKIAVEPLILALNDERDFVRMKVAKALGNIRDARAVEPLSQSLRDKNVVVQMNAGDALAKIGKPAEEILQKALKDKNTDVQIQASRALIKIRESQ